MSGAFDDAFQQVEAPTRGRRPASRTGTSLIPVSASVRPRSRGEDRGAAGGAGGARRCVMPGAGADEARERHLAHEGGTYRRRHRWRRRRGRRRPRDPRPDRPSSRRPTTLRTARSGRSRCPPARSSTAATSWNRRASSPLTWRRAAPSAVPTSACTSTASARRPERGSAVAAPGRCSPDTSRSVGSISEGPAHPSRTRSTRPRPRTGSSHPSAPEVRIGGLRRTRARRPPRARAREVRRGRRPW